MPVYEYRCEACGKDQEAIQKFSDAPLVDCELCGTKGALKKLVSRSSFALKGSGWYSTDYKKSSKPSGVASEAKPSGDAAGDKAAASPEPKKPSDPA